jgi:hypothetical protein
MSNEDKPTIKTNKPSDENRNDFFISISLKGAKQLREYLKIDENSYRYVASTAHTNARDYYIYGVLDEIEKAGMVLMNTLAFISEKEGEIKNRTGDRKVNTKHLCNDCRRFGSMGKEINRNIDRGCRL